MKYIAQEIPDSKLLLYGLKENYKNKIIRFAKSLNISDNIELQGCVKTKNIYERSSIYIMASYIEGYPLTVSEAKSYGIPVVVSGCEELWNTKFGTIKVKMNDVKSLANECIKLLKNETYLCEMGKKSRESLNNFTNDKIIIKWIQLINAVLKGDEEVIGLCKNQNYGFSEADSKKIVVNKYNYFKTHNMLKKKLNLFDMYSKLK